MTLQDWVRQRTNFILTALGRALWLNGVHPDLLTVAGTVFVCAGATLILIGELGWAATVILIGLSYDALDGATARAMNQPNRKFGGVLDSTLDRLADGWIFSCLTIHFVWQFEIYLVAFSLLALVGAYLTSYIRARAQAEGADVRGGVDRLLRMVTLLLGLAMPDLLPAVVIILAVTGLATAFYRLWQARQQLP